MIRIRSLALVTACLFVFDTHLQANPEIEVLRGSSPLTNGSSIPRLEIMRYGVNFDSFTIRNAGTTPLTGISMRLSGPGAAQFEVIPGLSTLAPSQQTFFDINYRPTTAGPHAAVLSIASNDADENPFRIVLSGSDRTILDFDGPYSFGPATPNVMVTPPTNFNTALTGFGSLSNAGFGMNEPTIMEFRGTSGFKVMLHSFKMAGFQNNQPMSFIRVRDADTDTILFNRSGGTLPRTGFTAFNFAKPLTGNRLLIEWQVAETSQGQSRVGIDDIVFSQPAPEIAVLGNGKDIMHVNMTLDKDPNTVNGTFFGPLSHLGTGAVRSFTLRNLGNEPLSLTTVSLTGSEAADFTIMQLPPPSLAPGASFNMPILCKPLGTGLRNAEVTIVSNDMDEPSFVFNIACHGGLPSMAPQSIVFNPPKTVYVGDTSGSRPLFLLKAISTLKLPITYTFISGPAILSPDNDLSFTGPGVVQVMASQPGAGRVSPAKPVTARITVLPAPTTLTLDDLQQVYNGDPRPVRVLGGTATVTYKVGGVFTEDAPTAAGTYDVKAGTVTGKLVIEKAPLFIGVNNETKFEGQANPSFTLSYDGFQGADNELSLSTIPTATTTANLTSPAGLYPITPAGAASANYAIYYLPGTLQINSAAGTYEALLKSPAAEPIGKVSLTIAAGRTFSATVPYTLTTKSFNFKGSVSTNFSNGVSTGTSTPVTLGADSYELGFMMDPGGANVAYLRKNSTQLGSGILGKVRVLPSGAAADHAGAYTLTLAPPLIFGTRPGGSGYATGSINAAGVLTVSGRLGDGVPFTASMPALEGANPGYVLFSQPYPTVRNESYLAGEFSMSPNLYVRNRRISTGSALSWRKAPGSTDATYRSGFALGSTALEIAPWFTPSPSLLPLAPSSSFVSGPTGLYLTFSDTGSMSQGDLPPFADVSSTQVITPPTPNTTKWTARLTTGTGLISGSFELVDGAVKRQVPFAGVLTQFLPGQSGRAHFVLPPLSGTERTTGDILFTTP